MSTATEMLALYIAAEAAVLKGQSYRYGERMLTRADLVEIRKGRAEWEARVAAENAGPGARRSISVADFSGRSCGGSFRCAE